MIDLHPDHLEIIQRILARHVPGAHVRVFGSRIDGTSAEYSDLDIAVMSSEQLSLDIQAALAEAFRESDLPFRVDVIDWSRTSDAFRKRIEKRFETIR